MKLNHILIVALLSFVLYSDLLSKLDKDSYLKIFKSIDVDVYKILSSHKFAIEIEIKLIK